MTSDILTLQEAKDYLGVTGSSEDTKIGLLVDAASDAVAQYLNYDPTSQAYTKTFDGDGSNSMLVMDIPLTAVASLSVNGTAITAAASITGPGFRFSNRMIVLNGYAFTKGFQNVVVTYTAGYTTMPEYIKLAAKMTLQAMYNAQDVDPNIVSEAVPGAYSASYQSRGPGAIPAAARTYLDNYVRRWW